MKSFRISLPGIPPRSYPVRFCAGPPEVARAIADVSGGARVFLVTDRNVRRHHGASLERGLGRESVDFLTVTLPPGERTKRRHTRDALEDLLLRSGAERSSIVAAFGGGVIGDLAGFAASTLLRGIRLIQVPTTLLSQVDSSVGGKVGIDHPSGKNLLGAFHQPEAVLIFPGYLRTLPEREFLQGMAEVVKYGAVLDRRLFSVLREQTRPIRSRRPGALVPVISRCCALKGRVVAADERDSGGRRILNFGHTIGHAIEHASGYRLPHGMAVSIGMAVEARISHAQGLLPARDLAELIGLLRSYRLPVTIPRGIDRKALLRAVAVDKKTSGGRVQFTLMTGVGRGVTGAVVPPGLLEEAVSR